jgi:two-component system OmpR family sensor kinase
MGRLFWKFFLSILLAQLAATIGIGCVVFMRDQARDRALLAAATQPTIDTGPVAELMIDSVAATLKSGGPGAVRELVGANTRQTIYVVDDKGRDILGRSVQPALQFQAEQLLALDAGRSIVRRLPAPDGSHYLVFVKWFDHRPPGAGFGMPPGAGEHHVPPPAMMHGLHALPPHHFWPLVPIVFALLASLLFAALLAWYFSRPIRALHEAFEAASTGDFTPRFAHVKGMGGDELNDLGRDFDRMSAQLHALMDGQRRLLHDVSHELRSPLARLQAAIGLAHQQPEKVAASLERIEREGVRMDKLVGELLTLSRLEASAALPRREDIALMDMIGEIAGDARFEAAQSGHDIKVSGLALVNVRGAPDLLWRAFENVVRNAIKHSPGSEAIEIEVTGTVQQVTVAVQDRGPGVDAADLENIFLPFYRSNAMSNDVNGHGLGLAIARRVIEAHAGTIEASNREGGGLRVAITLPVAN